MAVKSKMELASKLKKSKPNFYNSFWQFLLSFFILGINPINKNGNNIYWIYEIYFFGNIHWPYKAYSMRHLILSLWSFKTISKIFFVIFLFFGFLFLLSIKVERFFINQFYISLTIHFKTGSIIIILKRLFLIRVLLFSLWKGYPKIIWLFYNNYSGKLTVISATVDMALLMARLIITFIELAIKQKRSCLAKNWVNKQAKSLT